MACIWLHITNTRIITNSEFIFTLLNLLSSFFQFSHSTGETVSSLSLVTYSPSRFSCIAFGSFVVCCCHRRCRSFVCSVPCSVCDLYPVFVFRYSVQATPWIYADDNNIKAPFLVAAISIAREEEKKIAFNNFESRQPTLTAFYANAKVLIYLCVISILIQHTNKRPMQNATMTICVDDCLLWHWPIPKAWFFLLLFRIENRNRWCCMTQHIKTSAKRIVNVFGFFRPSNHVADRGLSVRHSNASIIGSVNERYN